MTETLSADETGLDALPVDAPSSLLPPPSDALVEIDKIKQKHDETGEGGSHALTQAFRKRFGASTQNNCEDGLSHLFPGTFKPTAKVDQFTLTKCLGAGADGEAWFVTSGSKEAVMKFDLDQSPSVVPKLQRSCLFAVLGNQRTGSRITSCLGMGQLNVEGANGAMVVVHYTVFEKANGETIMDIERASPTVPPAEFRDFGSIFDTVLSVTQLMADLSSELHSLRLFHEDLNPLNLLLDDKVVTAIDFDRVSICCTQQDSGLCKIEDAVKSVAMQETLGDVSKWGYSEFPPCKPNNELNTLNFMFFNILLRTMTIDMTMSEKDVVNTVSECPESVETWTASLQEVMRPYYKEILKSLPSVEESLSSLGAVQKTKEEAPEKFFINMLTAVKKIQNVNLLEAHKDNAEHNADTPEQYKKGTPAAKSGTARP